jgi:ketosteroid isomerase-like protein
VFYSLNENGPVALGWLRASHRELDPVRSRPEQPFHPHSREQRLAADEIVAVEIEIWPSATRFAAGERLRVIVQGRDIVPQETPNSPFARHEATRNRGTHVIHAGGQFDSHLLVPWIPPIGTAGASARPDAGNARNELTDAEYREYMAAFNRRDFAHFSSFYAPGVEFQGRGGHFSGRAAVVDFYQQVHARMRETIEIRQIVSSEQGLVADLVTELEALEDWPDFPTGPMTRGQIRRSQNFVWYEVSGKQFTRVRAAHYRRGAVLEVEPAPPAVTVGHSGAGVSAQAFAAYIDAFNRGDEAVYSGFYSPDVRLVIAGNQALVGPRAIVEFYRSVRRQARRTIQVKRVISTPAALAAELESEFTALEDLPDFPAGALRKGDRLQINTVVLYDVRDGQFARIRSARLSKRHWPAL